MKKRILSLVLVVAMVATLFAGLTLTASAAGTTIASWANAKWNANTAYAASSGTGSLTTEVAITTAGSGNAAGYYYASSWTSGKSIIITGLNTANFTDIQLDCAIRASAAGTLTVYTSADGSTYTQLTTKTTNSAKTPTAVSVTGIPTGTQAIKLTYGATGSFFFGDLVISGTAGTTPPASEETEAPATEAPATEAPSSEEPAPSGDGYTLVTDASTLAAGDKLIIVGADKNGAYYGLKAYESGNNFKSEAISAPVSNTITLPAGSAVAEITLGGAAGAWTFYDGAKYLSAEGGTDSNYMKGVATAGDNAKWTVAISDGLATIVCANSATTRNTMRLNYGTATNIMFAAYLSTYATNVAYPALYRKAAGPVDPTEPSSEPTEPSVEPTEPTEPIVPSGDGYTLVTDVSVLTAGDKLLLVGIKEGTYYALAPYVSGNNCKCNVVPAPVEGVIETDAAPLTLGGAAGAWTLYDGTYYLYAADDNGSHNYLKGAANADNDNAKWTIAISGGVPTIKTVDSTVARHTIRFNLNAPNDPLFACYASGQTDYAIYRKAATICLHENYEDREAVDATCTAPGFTAGRYCLDCNTYISGGEVTVALGHDYVVENTTAPTCTEAGLDTYTCSRCTDSYTKDVPATGHNYENGVCTVCGADEPAAEEYALVDTLADGDEVILYNPNNGVAIKNGSFGGNWYLEVAAVAPTDGVISTYDSSIVWTVTYDDESDKYIFENGDNAITAWLSGSYLEVCNDPTIEGADAEWTISDANIDAHTHLLGSAVKTNAYLEVYTKNVNGTSQLAGCGYTSSAAAADSNFGFQFYVKGATVACDHVWGEPETTTAPTCTEAGLATYTCTKCTETKTEAIPALGHIDENEDGLCDRCSTALEVYTLSTTAPAVGYDYIIVAESNGKYYALDNTENGTGSVTTCTEVVPVNNTILCTGDYAFTAAEGTYNSYTGIGFLQLGSETLYLHLNSGKIRVTTTAQNGTFDFASGTAANTFTMKNNQGTTGKFLTFANGSFNVGETGTDLYFYAKASAVPAEHVHEYAFDGNVGANGYHTEVCANSDGKCDELTRSVACTFVEGFCTVCGAAEPEPLELEGDFYIAAIRSSGNYWYMKGELTTDSTKRFVATDTGLTELPAEITTPDAAYIWTIGQDGDGNYTLYNAAAGKYASWTSGNSGALADVALPLVITEVEGGYEFTYITGGEKDRTIALNSTSGNNYFAFYEGTQAKTLVLIPVNGEVCEHEETTLTGAVAATCTEAGYTGDLVCDDCGAVVTAGEAIPALGHIDENEDLICDRCDADLTPVELEGYTLVTDAADLADGDVFVFGATKDGTTYGSGAINTKYLDSVEATLTDDVLTGEGLVEITLIAVNGGWNLKIGDKFINTTAVKALTFADDASTVWTIDIDENGLATVAAGDYGRFLYNVNSPRFLNYDSSTTAIMLLPSLYKASGAPVPPTPVEHTSAWLDGQAADCENDGFIGYYYCVDCFESGEHFGKCYSDAALTEEIADITIAALGHTWVDPDLTDGNLYMAPTCTEDGIKYQVCSECGAIAETGIIIEALGHDRVEDAAVPATCTATGLTAGYHCSRCDDDTLAQEVIPALGHDLAWDGNVGDGNHTLACSRCEYTETEACDTNGTDGACSVCGYKAEPAGPIEEPTLVFLTHALSMQDSLTFNYIVQNKILKNYDSFYVEFTGMDYATRELKTVRDYGTKDGTNWLFFYSVFSMQMTEEFTAQIHAFKDGQEYVSAVSTESVEAYALSKIGSVTEAQKAIFANMLEYGTQSQLNFNYKTDDLANANLGSYASYVTTTAPEVINQTATTGTAGTVTLMTSALGLEEAVKPQFIIRIPKDDNKANYYAIVTIERNGVEESIRIDSSEWLDDSARNKVIYVEGITAKEGKKAVNLTIYSVATDEAVSQTFTYSIQSHVYKTQNNAAAAGTQSLATLNALMNYYNAVEAVYG